MSDPLLDKIAATQKRVQQFRYEKQKQFDQSATGKLSREVSAWSKFWYRFSSSIAWIYKTLIWPITRRLLLSIKWIATKYRDLFIWVSYKKDKYGDSEFSKIRGGLTIIATVFAVMIASVLIEVGTIGIFWYLPTVQHDEELYLYNSQKISDGLNLYSTMDDVHEVHGCESLPCTDQNSVTFHVRGSWFNEFWSIAHHGTLFYPGYVAGAVAPIMEQCTITSYGIRKKFKALIRQWDIYPDLIQVKKCQPADKNKIIDNKDYR